MSKKMQLVRIIHLKVQNYRPLRDVELRDLTPFTVLVGPNGSGKSTVFDVFAFLAETFELGLRRAWDKRGRAKELKSRGGEGPVTIEIKYQEPGYPVVTYHLAVDEKDSVPIVVEEWLQWRQKENAKPFRFLDYRLGNGEVVSGEAPDETDNRISVPLKSADVPAANTLGQLAEYPRVVALREFITGWYVSYLSAESARSFSETGPHERLTRNSDNLVNVIQYLKERDPGRLETMERVPRFEKIQAGIMGDGRLLLELKDAPFDSPTLARFGSDGTLKLLAYLVILLDPSPPPFIGIEVPENFLHPRLLPELAEECRAAAERTQIFATTHSPFFLNSLRPGEVRVLWRDAEGYTRSEIASCITGVNEFCSNGSLLGDLWMEGHLEVGDPLINHGAPGKIRENAR
ncbi:MAG: AAA family ATPase [Rectinemataceae bacterium]